MKRITDEEIRRKFDQLRCRDTSPTKDAIDIANWAMDQAAAIDDLMVIDLQKIWENSPEWADRIELTWVKKGHVANPIGPEYIYHRPATALTPEEGEAVFFWLDSCEAGHPGKSGVGIYHNGGVVFGLEWRKLVANPKPFDPAKIGLPWDKI